MNVMLLAAGEGTRLAPHTHFLPKPAIPFLNVPLACYPIEHMFNLSIDNFVVNTFHLPEKIHDLFNQIKTPSSQIKFSDEKGVVLGSGGGLKLAEKKLTDGNNEPILLVNADELILPKDLNFIKNGLAQHNSKSAFATLFVIRHLEAGSKFGAVWSDEKGSVLDFGKTKIHQHTEPWHFIGMQILSQDIFKYLPDSGPSNILYDGLKQAIENGERVQIYEIDALWFETGNESDFLNATSECIKLLNSDSENVGKKYLTSVLQRQLENDFKLFEHVNQNSQSSTNTVKSDGKTKTSSEKSNAKILSTATSGRSPNANSPNHKQIQIDSSNEIHGFVVLGKNCEIGKRCQLTNVVIGPNVKLADNSQIKNKIILN